MQISGHGKADHLAKLLLGVQEPSPSNSKQSSAKPGGKDQVHISDQAKELQRIETLSRQPDQARSERINRIRQALDNGTYDVGGRAVADALIKHALTEAVL
jgi:negative regulator of flagellin synthesis FlgM